MRLTGRRDPDVAPHVTKRVREDQHPPIDALVVVAPAPDPALLHLEQVSEVHVAEQLHEQWNCFEAVIRDHQPFSHARRDVPVAHHHHVSISLPDRWRATGHVHRRERLRHSDRQSLQRMAVQAQLPARRHPRIQEEQPLRQGRMHVPRRRRDAEGLTLDQSDLARRLADRDDWRPGLPRRCVKTHRAPDQHAARRTPRISRRTRRRHHWADDRRAVTPQPSGSGGHAELDTGPRPLQLHLGRWSPRDRRRHRAGGRASFEVPNGYESISGVGAE